MRSNKRMFCSKCRSEEVRRNADVAWNISGQCWEIVAIFDSATCESCEGECDIDEELEVKIDET